MPSIKFALGLKPDAAIEWLKAKGVTAESYRNLTASEIANTRANTRVTTFFIFFSPSRKY